jgi:hypothetical protein
VATIPPDARFTTAQEAVREVVNSYILSTDTTGSYLNGNADGAVDFAAAVSSTGTDAGTTVAAADLYNGNPDNAYYQALALQYITSTAATGGTVHIQPNVARPGLPPAFQRYAAWPVSAWPMTRVWISSVPS